jgi:hypothetical protein
MPGAAAMLPQGFSFHATPVKSTLAQLAQCALSDASDPVRHVQET